MKVRVRVRVRVRVTVRVTVGLRVRVRVRGVEAWVSVRAKERANMLRIELSYGEG